MFYFTDNVNTIHFSSGFINPPSNLACHVTRGARLFEANLAWDPPTVNTWPHAIIKYTISYLEPQSQKHLSLEPDIYNTSFELNSATYIYTFQMTTKSDQQTSAAATCKLYPEHLGKRRLTTRPVCYCSHAMDTCHMCKTIF